MITKFKLFNHLHVSANSKKEIIFFISNYKMYSSSFSIALCNAHMFIESYDNSKFKNQLESFDLVLPDGKSISYSLSYFSSINVERYAGMDLIEDLFKIANENKSKIFILGSSPETIDKVKRKSQKFYKNIKSIDFNTSEISINSTDFALINQINKVKPDYLLVCLGCPKQEKWISMNKKYINTCFIGLGGAINTFSGNKLRAPKCIQNIGMEWFFRFLQEPRRLFIRYTYTNTKFIFIFIKSFLTRIIKN